MSAESASLDWFKNDDLFFSELEKGHRYTIEVARRLRLLGIDANITQITKRIHVDDRDLYEDEADIIIPGSPLYVVEVKSRDLYFECAHDFPYQTIFVDTVNGWDKKNPKPIAVVNVSRQTLGMAVIRASTSAHWGIKIAHDHVRDINDTFYIMDRDRLVGFGSLVEYLRQRGRIIRQDCSGEQNGAK